MGRSCSPHGEPEGISAKVFRQALRVPRWQAGVLRLPIGITQSGHGRLWKGLHGEKVFRAIEDSVVAAGAINDVIILH